ncbi:hypothetical protein M0804_013884 [Polistes exclamans]|nr:hypothetical protein M0804_013884 [Polistes exclamans]
MGAIAAWKEEEIGLIGVTGETGVRVRAAIADRLDEWVGRPYSIGGTNGHSQDPALCEVRESPASTQIGHFGLPPQSFATCPGSPHLKQTPILAPGAGQEAATWPLA